MLKLPFDANTNGIAVSCNEFRRWRFVLDAFANANPESQRVHWERFTPGGSLWVHRLRVSDTVHIVKPFEVTCDLRLWAIGYTFN